MVIDDEIRRLAEARKQASAAARAAGVPIDTSVGSAANPIVNDTTSLRGRANALGRGARSVAGKAVMPVVVGSHAITDAERVAKSVTDPNQTKLDVASNVSRGVANQAGGVIGGLLGARRGRAGAAAGYALGHNVVDAGINAAQRGLGAVLDRLDPAGIRADVAATGEAAQEAGSDVGANIRAQAAAQEARAANNPVSSDLYKSDAPVQDRRDPFYDNVALGEIDGKAYDNDGNELVTTRPYDPNARFKPAGFDMTTGVPVYDNESLRNFDPNDVNTIPSAAFTGSNVGVANNVSPVGAGVGGGGGGARFVNLDSGQNREALNDDRDSLLFRARQTASPSKRRALLGAVAEMDKSETAYQNAQINADSAMGVAGINADAMRDNALISAESAQNVARSNAQARGAGGVDKIKDQTLVLLTDQLGTLLREGRGDEAAIVERQINAINNATPSSGKLYTATDAEGNSIVYNPDGTRANKGEIAVDMANGLKRSLGKDFSRMTTEQKAQALSDQGLVTQLAQMTGGSDREAYNTLMQLLR